MRAIWLECCGHLSAFSDGYDDVSFETRLGQIEQGFTFLHEYDFGSTTHSKITVVSEMDTSFSIVNNRYQVQLVARNEPYQYRCCVCGESAVANCETCNDERSYQDSLYCQEHLDAHLAEDPDHDWDYIDTTNDTNSPRMGVCAYEGTTFFDFDKSFLIGTDN
jgi:hypothetical protein